MDLIVNADDLGMSREGNKTTFSLMEQGLVTSSTLLANGPYIEEACQFVSEFPQCSFCAHLNVTEFLPLTGSSHLSALLDDTGSFDRNRIRQIPIDSALAEGIFDEYCAQVETLQSLGIRLSHLDSHHYVLTIPRIFPILKRLQKKYQIRKVRITRNIYADRLIGRPGLTAEVLGLGPDFGAHDVSGTLRLKKWAYNFLLRHYYRTETTQGFSGFRLFYEYARSRIMKHRTFEVTVHPENPYYDPSEIAILESSWREELNFPVRLISYLEL